MPSTMVTMANTPSDPEQSMSPSGPDDSNEAQPLRKRVSRRSFLSHLGATGVAVTAQPLLAAAHSATQSSTLPAGTAEDSVPPPAGAVPVTLRVNGQQHRLQIEPRVTLLDCLRENLQLSGTKKGCDHGQCGACTVHIEGRRVNSCLALAVMHQGQEITTIEGIGQPGHLHPMQAAFIEQDGYQCGYCTSGQIMSAVALLKEPVGPTDDDVKQAMYGNICRCGAYPNIVAAVQQARLQA